MHSFSPTFIKNINEIRKAKNNKKLVVFAGAGVSIDSGAPSWNSLIEKLSNDIQLPEGERDSLRIAQMYFNERGQKEFIDTVRDGMAHKKLMYNALHEEIFELEPEHILTTNFDNLFEQVIKSKAHPFSVIKNDAGFPYSINNNLLVKIHGDLDDGSIILKEEDYLEYSSKQPLLTSFLKSVFANKVVVFIGYSFSDLDLKIILQNVRGILKSDFQNAYLLSVDDNYHPTMRNYLKGKGINVVTYEDAKSEQGNYIDAYLSNINIDYKNLKSDAAKSLLRLLKFICEYDHFTESLKKKNAIDQMYDSLQRFEGLSTLTPGFISNLLPFRSHEPILFRRTKVFISNPVIADFFKNYVNEDSATIRDDFFLDYQISGEDIQKYNEKFDEILKWIILSGTRMIDFEIRNKVGDAVDYKPIVITKPIHCTCLMCTYNQFNFSAFLTKLDDYNFNETSDIQSDMRFAYGHYKAGNFNESSNLFEQIANKSWQKGNYIIYYIAKQNVKYLRTLIYLHSSSKEEKIETYIQRSDKIDLKKLISRLPGLDKECYSILQKIQDNDLISHTSEFIDSLSYELLTALANTSFDGHASNKNSLVEFDLILMLMFYSNNNIVLDEYSDFTNTVNKGLTGLFINAVGNHENNMKPLLLKEDILRVILLYGHEDSLYKTFSNYRINTIEIPQSDIGQFVSYVQGFFSSFFQLDVFNKPIPNKTLLEQFKKRNSFFEQKLKDYASKLFMICARVKLPEKYVDVTIKKFIFFITNFPCEKHQISKHINSLISSWGDYYSLEDCYTLISLCEQKDVYAWDRTFLRIVTDIIAKRFSTARIKDYLLIEKITASCNRNNSISYAYLWKITDNAYKKVLEDSIRNKLNEHFALNIYIPMCYEGIIHPKEYYHSFFVSLDFVRKQILSTGLEQVLHHSFVFFTTMLTDLDIQFEEYENYINAELPESWKFALSPENFDYSKFNPKWIVDFQSQKVITRLKNIPKLVENVKNYITENNDKYVYRFYIKNFAKEAVVESV